MSDLSRNSSDMNTASGRQPTRTQSPTTAWHGSVNGHAQAIVLTADRPQRSAKSEQL